MIVVVFILQLVSAGWSWVSAVYCLTSRTDFLPIYRLTLQFRALARIVNHFILNWVLQRMRKFAIITIIANIWALCNVTMYLYSTYIYYALRAVSYFIGLCITLARKRKSDVYLHICHFNFNKLSKTNWKTNFHEYPFSRQYL